MMFFTFTIWPCCVPLSAPRWLPCLSGSDNCNKRDNPATLAFHHSCFHQVWKISLHIFRDDDDDDDDGDSPPPGTTAITSFFAPKSDSVERRRHQFFLERQLEPIDSF